VERIVKPKVMENGQEVAHDLRMLSHAEIVIRAPNRDLRNGSVRPAPFGAWEAAGDASMSAKTR
jgi:hypothetical protein